jgi:single-strand DNA-binding protein
MLDLNSVQLIGRLVRDPESREVNDNTVTRFSIAVNGWKDSVSFFDVEAWNGAGKGVQAYALKGRQVAVLGELKQNRFEVNGQSRSKIVVSARSVYLLGSRSENETSGNPSASALASTEDIPF